MFTAIQTAAVTSSNTVAAPLHAQGATNHPALTPIHWWHDCGKDGTDERSAALAPIAAGFNTGEAAGVIEAARGKTRNGYVSRAWSLALTAVHGPIGMHPEQTQHPEVIRIKARALADLRTYLSV